MPPLNEDLGIFRDVWGEPDEVVNDDTQDPETPASPEPSNSQPPPQSAVDEIADALEKEDPNHKVVKGLQRVISKRDRENQALRQELDSVHARLNAMEPTLNGVQQGYEWLSGVTYDALPEEAQQEAMQKLNQRRLAITQGELDKSRQREQARAQAQYQAQQQQAQPVQQQAPDDAFEAVLAQHRNRFTEGRRAAAQQMGLDPADTRIDYGADTDDLNTRLEKFDASTRKVLQNFDDELDEVRAGPAPASRSNGGSMPSANGVEPDYLKRGSAERMRQITRSSRGI